ncbi:MAG: hypothetical protein ABIS67_01535 [Candidatus Eisenbacteria bacterium]
MHVRQRYRPAFSSRKFLEFDHMDEVARGGEASVERIRLRCRAHNQYDAECTLGAEFMRQKRQAAADARTVAKARESAEALTAAEERVRVALSWFPLRGTRTSPVVARHEAAAPGGAGSSENPPGRWPTTGA